MDEIDSESKIRGKGKEGRSKEEGRETYWLLCTAISGGASVENNKELLSYSFYLVCCHHYHITKSNLQVVATIPENRPNPGLENNSKI